MEPFTLHTGRIAVMNSDNVDTDRIIPARFLSRVSRSGYGELLFADVRGEGFALDRRDADGASVLVVGTNFGCGSSREHAVWALQQAGFRVVIARKTDSEPGFSDIFRQNSANCGLLLVELEPEAHQVLVDAGSGAIVDLDLPSQTVTLGSQTFPFDISETSKVALVHGHDLIGTTLLHAAAIDAFEGKGTAFVPAPQ